ncbi:MAG: hypothetical protein AAGA05_12860, partial [Pseudomonadota bacterium]
MSHAVPTNETRRRHSVGTKHRGEDVADALSTSEGKLVVALVSETGQRRAVVGPTHADAQMAATVALAEVIPLARKLSAIHENLGHYRSGNPSSHAEMVLIDAVDL